MSAARATAPFKTLFTNSNWEEDIAFCIDSLDQAENWAGSDAVITLVRRGLIPAELVISTLGETPGIRPCDASGYVLIRTPKAVLSNLPSGTYDGLLMRTRPDGSVETALIFVVPVERD